MYPVRFHNRASKKLKSVHPLWQRRIKEKIEVLARDPSRLQHNIKKLKDQYKQFAQLRMGNYRIIFKVQKRELLILLIRIAHRQEVY